MNHRKEPRALLGLVVLAAMLATTTSCRTRAKPTPEPTTDEPKPEPKAAAAPAIITPVPAEVCPSVDKAKLAPFEIDRSKVKVEPPEIIDPKATLAPFYDQLIGLARGTRQGHLRIGVYGDSNLTSDHLTGHVRRQLQGRFGDAGHGYVALAMPWAWYTHEDVHHHGTWSAFKQLNCTTDIVPGHRYGFANLGAESDKKDAAAWVATADETAPIGKTAGQFEIYFLKQPRGGSFDVLLDGKVVRTVSTLAADFEAGFEKIEAPDARHEVKCVVKGDGMVRFYGATLERDPRSVAQGSGAQGSVVVDALGTGAMNFQRFMLTEPSLRKAQLAHRKYDLVMVWLGVNTSWVEGNRPYAKATLEAIREALPGVPLLVISPPDTVKEGEKRSEPRIVQLVKQLREVAAESGAAFWDMRAAMGGEASYIDFMKLRYASPDRAHLLPNGATLMGQRLLSVMFGDVAKRLEKVPDAGCARKN